MITYEMAREEREMEIKTFKPATHYIYCKAPGTKKALMLMPSGQLTMRKVFAARFSKEIADIMVRDGLADNEGWEIYSKEIA